MTIELADIIRTTIIVVLIIFSWKIIKQAARQTWTDTKRKARKVKRRYGVQTHNIMRPPKPKPKRARQPKPSSMDIMSGLLGDEDPIDAWPPDNGQPWPRTTTSQQDFTNARKGAMR